MKMWRVFVLALLIVAADSSMLSQTERRAGVFVSGHVGAFFVDRGGFSSTYGSGPSFAFGGGAGFPISPKITLCGKATYVSRTGIPVTRVFSHPTQNNNFVDLREGMASFKLWTFNLGLQYSFFLTEGFTVGVNGGATIVKFAEDRNGLHLPVPSSIHVSGPVGLFLGLGLEKRFQDGPIAILAEGQYNLTEGGLIAALGNCGGTNLSLGLRYYIAD